MFSYPFSNHGLIMVVLVDEESPAIAPASSSSQSSTFRNHSRTRSGSSSFQRLRKKWSTVRESQESIAELPGIFYTVRSVPNNEEEIVLVRKWNLFARSRSFLRSLFRRNKSDPKNDDMEPQTIWFTTEMNFDLTPDNPSDTTFNESIEFVI